MVRRSEDIEGPWEKLWEGDWEPPVFSDADGSPDYEGFVRKQTQEEERRHPEDGGNGDINERDIRIAIRTSKFDNI